MNYDRRIFQVIYQNCPNLKYFRKLIYNNSDLKELENLLIHCQCLSGLFIISDYGYLNWNYLFEILTKSSPLYN
jgi:hypothetical protein